MRNVWPCGFTLLALQNGNVASGQAKKDSGAARSGGKSGGDADADDDASAAKRKSSANGAAANASEASAEGEDGDTSGAEVGSVTDCCTDTGPLATHWSPFCAEDLCRCLLFTEGTWSR